MRAARAFAGLTQAALAKKLGVQVLTVKRMEKGERGFSLDALYAVADKCKVPREFMSDGWAGAPLTLRDAERLSEGIVSTLAAEIEQLHATLAKEAAQALASGAVGAIREP